jgi:hypothetical protein
MEPYHRQPPAKRADSKLKKAKKDGPYPPTISIIPYPPQQNPKEEKSVQSRHPPQATAQINCTGPTLHTAEPYALGKYDPARQRSSQGPSTPKINRTRDECNKWINTQTTAYKCNEKRRSHQKKNNIQRKENRHKNCKNKRKSKAYLLST